MNQAQVLTTMQAALDQVDFLFWATEIDSMRENLAVLQSSLTKIVTELQKDNLIERTEDFSIASKEVIGVIMPAIMTLEQDLQKDVKLAIAVHSSLEILESIKNVLPFFN